MPTSHSTHAPPRPPHEPWRAPRALAAVAVAALLTFGACRDAPPTSPLFRGAPPAPSYTTLPPPGNGTATVPADPRSGAGTVTVTPSYDSTTLVVGTISGTVLMSTTPAGSAYPTNPIDARGFAFNSQCYLQFSVYWRATGKGVYGQGGCPNPQYVTSRSFTDTILVRGPGVASRQAGPTTSPTTNCTYYQCYAYSGSQSVSVTPLQFDLTGTASPAILQTAGTYVTFSPKPSVATVNYNAVPFNVSAWRWEAAGGVTPRTADSVCKAWTKSCYLRVYESGTMVIDGTVNGFARQARVSMHVGPADLALAASKSWVPAGDSVTFTARPVPDSSGGQPTAMTITGWAWKDDSAATFATVPACGSNPACRVAVLKSGAMRVIGAVVGRPDTAQKSVEVLVPKLVCPGTVTRGQSASCSITNTGSQSVTVSEWRFADSALTAIVVDTTKVSAWAGAMVVSGSVRAASTIGGVSFTDSAVISVTSRGWAPITTQVLNVGHAGLTYPPGGAGDLTDTQIAVPGQFSGVPMNIQFQRIAAGPNQGWAYLTQHINPVVIAVRWNQAWNPTDQWYQSQSGGTNPSGQPYCTQNDMPIIEQRAREHEGEVQGPSNSHVSVYRDFFASLANASSTTPQARMEGLVWRSTSFVGQSDSTFAQTEFQNIVAAPASADPRQIHYNPTTQSGGPMGDVPLAIFPCYLRY